LLVEDDEALRTTVSDRLRGEKYAVQTAADAEEGLSKATAFPFDLLIIDVMLPDRSGFDLCCDVRRSCPDVPILFLTARASLADIVVGLKLGGGDYVTKPFEEEELIARIEALLRRHPVRQERGIIKSGSLLVDVVHREVIRDGKPISLTEQEFNLLLYLMERPGQTVSRAEVLKAVWGYEETTYSRTVDVHIFSLRQKLEEDPGQPELIRTVTGVGYRFRRA
jgi:DNA-binding response OmpR family regulator